MVLFSFFLLLSLNFIPIYTVYLLAQTYLLAINGRALFSSTPRTPQHIPLMYTYTYSTYISFIVTLNIWHIKYSYHSYSEREHYIILVEHAGSIIIIMIIISFFLFFLPSLCWYHDDFINIYTYVFILTFQATGVYLGKET